MPEPEYIDLGIRIINGITVRRKVATDKTEEEKIEIMRRVLAACINEKQRKKKDM